MIPQKIKELATKVRNEVYGKDVREAIAKSIEESGETAENARIITQQLIDGSFDEGILNTEIEQRLINLETEYAPKLNKVTEDLAQTTVYAPSPSAYWKSPIMPPARTDNAGYFTNAFSHTQDDYLANLLEPLRNAHSDYISRKNLGKDTSGEYDVWQYNFTPKNYEKTIIVTANLHGSEIQSFLSFYLFMKEVAENWRNDPQLAYIRHKVRILSIPIANPWGTSQLPTKKRANVNNVNLNRNFDYKWSSQGSTNTGSNDYRGTAPFSEKETQYIRDLIMENTDAVAYIDMHALSAGSGYKGLAYIPRSQDFDTERVTNFFKVFAGDNYSLRMSENAFGMNWVAENFGIQSITPEFTTKEFGEQQFDSVEMTASTEYYGNIIIQASTLEQKVTDLAYFDPVVHKFEYVGTSAQHISHSSTDTSYTDIPELRGVFDVSTKGIVIVNATILLKCDSETSNNYLVPTIGQAGGLFEPNITTGDSLLYSGTHREAMSYQIVAPVLPSTDGGNGPVHVGLRLRTTVGATIQILRYYATATFIPSRRADSVKTYVATGNEGMGIGAMEHRRDGFKN